MVLPLIHYTNKTIIFDTNFLAYKNNIKNKFVPASNHIMDDNYGKRQFFFNANPSEISTLRVSLLNLEMKMRKTKSGEYRE